MAVNFSKVNAERAFRASICKDLKPKNVAKDIVGTANKLVHFIGKAFEFKSKNVVPTLLNVFLGLHFFNIAFISGHSI